MFISKTGESISKKNIKLFFNLFGNKSTYILIAKFKKTTIKFFFPKHNIKNHRKLKKVSVIS